MTLVDFDTLSRGDAEADLATYLSHLLLNAGGTDDAGRVFSERAKRFLDAYEAFGGTVVAPRLGCYLASALLRLGAIHLFRLPRPRASDPLWRAARAALGNQTRDVSGSLDRVARAAYD